MRLRRGPAHAAAVSGQLTAPPAREAEARPGLLPAPLGLGLLEEEKGSALLKWPVCCRDGGRGG